MAERKVREEGVSRKEEVREKFRGWDVKPGEKMSKTLTGRG